MATYTKATPGAPNSGRYSVGDLVTDSVGVEWHCVQAGIPGVFVPKLDGLAHAVSGAGTANGATVAATEFGSGKFHYTILTCTATPIAIADDAAVAQYGGVKVYDFPAGHVVTLGAVINGALTGYASLIDTFDGDVALGSATATTGATLTGTEADILQSTALTQAVAEVANCDAASIATALTESGARWFADSAALDMFLNFVIDDNAAHGAGTATFTGTIVFPWINMGNS